MRSPCAGRRACHRGSAAAASARSGLCWRGWAGSRAQGRRGWRASTAGILSERQILSPGPRGSPLTPRPSRSARHETGSNGLFPSRTPKRCTINHSARLRRDNSEMVQNYSRRTRRLCCKRAKAAVPSAAHRAVASSSGTVTGSMRRLRHDRDVVRVAGGHGIRTSCPEENRVGADGSGAAASMAVRRGAPARPRGSGGRRKSCPGGTRQCVVGGQVSRLPCPCETRQAAGMTPAGGRRSGRNGCSSGSCWSQPRRPASLHRRPARRSRSSRPRSRPANSGCSARPTSRMPRSAWTSASPPGRTAAASSSSASSTTRPPAS